VDGKAMYKHTTSAKRELDDLAQNSDAVNEAGHLSLIHH
jgi:hypothetical protein